MQPPPPPPPPPAPPVYHPAMVENGGHPGQRESKELVLCLNMTHNLTQMCLGGVIVSALILPNVISWYETVSIHIVLCTMGYFILMTQAVMAFSPYGWANNLEYEKKKIIHLAFQVFGSILAIAGSIVKFADSDASFDSAHGICGFLAMLLTIITLIGGVLNFLFSNKMNNNLMKILHSCCGTVTLMFAFISLVFALHYYYRTAVGNGNANFSIVITMFALVGTVLMAAANNARRILNK
ncbi:uncharacterized protein LOC142979961 [Anticarsia gemmatalis]|uniref:uncharacterized protein LOC142979961 n=1 Tax=Anticarsia gemmatalis TaxID=129554 RepID=UPI003F76CD87